jgi:hypothetical protein
MELDQDMWNWFQTYGLPPGAEVLTERCAFRHEGERCTLDHDHDGGHSFEDR